MGLVEKSQLDKRTDQYALTDDGEAAVADQLEWVRSQFVTGDDRTDAVRDRIDARV